MNEYAILCLEIYRFLLKTKGTYYDVLVTHLHHDLHTTEDEIRLALTNLIDQGFVYFDHMSHMTHNFVAVEVGESVYGQGNKHIAAALRKAFLILPESYGWTKEDLNDRVFYEAPEIYHEILITMLREMRLLKSDFNGGYTYVRSFD